MKDTLVRLFWFVLVGCTAAAVHFGMVVLLVGTFGWAPLVANIGGWLVAFVVSFSGQSMLTFRGHGVAWLHALPRFFGISAAGFLANETSYAVLLRFVPLPYQVSLAIVLVAVAVMTYLLSSRWAFRRRTAG